MQIATWNVNSLSVRLPQVLAWLAANPVDALGLQELKLVDEKFPHDAFEAAGYHAVCFGQKTYNGVAIVSRTPARMGASRKELSVSRMGRFSTALPCRAKCLW